MRDEQTNGQAEAANALADAGAGIGRNVVALEQAEAHGHYTATLIGPREECRAAYIPMRDEVMALEMARGFLARIRNKRRIAHLRAQMAEMEEVKWADDFDNVVTTAGKNDALDKYLAGSSYTAAWYLGLIDNGSWSAVAAGDTAASHAGWTENVGYSQSTRPAAAWSAASSGSKALSSAAAFTINADDTIKGCFLISNSTKSGTTGILYSAGLFTGGDKVVQNGDTLNVSYTASL